MVLLPCSLVLLAFLSVEGKIREAKDGEFPFQVSIKNTQDRHVCGGAIITPKWVITAYLCADQLRPKEAKVCYGSADSNSMDCVDTKRIVLQNNQNVHGRSRFALMELQTPITFSKNVQPAALPTVKASLRNTTKLSGWKIDQFVDVPPNLYVADVYSVILKECRSPLGGLVDLRFDEFCGVDDELMNSVVSLGMVVSKRAVVLGMMTEIPLAQTMPCIFIKLFEHEQWIRNTLEADAEHVNWVDEVPRDSAITQTAISFGLVGVSAVLLHFIA